jgi:uncharacterized membrane protein YgcG
MDQVQIKQATPGPDVDEQYWNKWYCLNKSGSEALYLQRDGSWSRGRFYFDTEQQVRTMLAGHHSTAVQESYMPKSTVDEPSDDSSLNLDILGGGSSIFGGGGGDFGGGGAGGDW